MKITAKYIYEELVMEENKYKNLIQEYAELSESEPDLQDLKRSEMIHRRHMEAISKLEAIQIVIERINVNRNK